jgi:integrase
MGLEVRSISAEVFDHWLAKKIKIESAKQSSIRETFLHELELWTKTLRKQKHGELKEALARVQRSGALRISEAAAIHWEDVNWKERSITIRRSVDWPRKNDEPPEIKEGFKNGDEKVIPIGPDPYGLLEVLAVNRSGKLVFHLNGAILQYRFIQHAYDAAAEVAGVDFTGTHAMRRTGASWILNQTGDIDLAKELLGNTTWSSVKPYAQRESKALTDYNNRLWKEDGGKDHEPHRRKLHAVRSSWPTGLFSKKNR